MKGMLYFYPVTSFAGIKPGILTLISSRKGQLRGNITMAFGSPSVLLNVKVGTSCVKRSDGSIEQYLVDNQSKILVADRDIQGFVSLRMHMHGSNERGSIVVRAHASHEEGLRFEQDSMPWLNARSLFTQPTANGNPTTTLGR